MLGLSSPVKLCRKAAALVLLAPLVLTACTSGESPTSSQAGQTLKTHILQLLKERNADNIAITDPGGKNIPCAKDKAKQTFAASGRDLPERKPDALIDSLLGALKRVAPYQIVSSGTPGQPIRVENKTTRTILVLGSPVNGKYVVSGETQCLDVR
ncbi:hypothetical protein [Sphaerisporangium perillae]|uniref:hypothetical protein n=1 Tax=Sphaerisporangium perillae TaxID=2935860 RepID=UPI0020102A05|nr:hypothetical protein [Sphaerisporangium perillae]